MKDIVIMKDKKTCSLTSGAYTAEYQMGIMESPTVSQELLHAHL
jgi:hypothetical protein